MPPLPRAIDLTLHPERRRRDAQPLQVDLRTVILVGTVAWIVAAIVLVAAGVVGEADVSERLWVCAAGLGLGIAGLVWEHANRRRYRAQGDRPSPRTLGDDAPGQSTSTDIPPGP